MWVVPGSWWQGTYFWRSPFISEYVHVLVTFAFLLNLTTVGIQAINAWLTSDTLFSISCQTFRVRICVLRSKGSFIPFYRYVHWGKGDPRFSQKGKIWNGVGSLWMLCSPTTPLHSSTLWSLISKWCCWQVGIRPLRKILASPWPIP